jgi:hypothetical protein
MDVSVVHGHVEEGIEVRGMVAKLVERPLLDVPGCPPPDRLLPLPGEQNIDMVLWGWHGRSGPRI